MLNKSILSKILPILLTVMFLFLFTYDSYSQTYTLNPGATSWTPLAGETQVVVECWGAGGAGDAGGATNGAGGGGGGAYVKSVVLNVTPGTPIALSVGSGGIMGVDVGNGSGAGGSTYFISIANLFAGGGGGAAGVTGGTAGTPAGTDVDPGFGFNGGAGGNGWNNNNGAGGGGGSSAGTGINGNNGANATASGAGAGGLAPTGGWAGGTGGTKNNQGEDVDEGTIPGNVGCGGGGAGDSGTPGGKGAGGKIVITVVPANNAPVISVPGVLIACEDGTLALGNPPSIADADGDTQGVTITVTNGTLDLTNSGVTIVGDGTANVSITNNASATITDINAAFSGAIFTPTSAFTGTANIKIDTDDGNGGTDSKNFDITVNATPTATAANNGPICVGGTLTLTGGVDGLTSYSWSGPDAYSSSVQSPTVSTSATIAMAGTYTLTVTNNGCVNTATTDVTINDVLSAGAITGLTSVAESSSNTYSVTAQGGATNYIWTFPATWSPTSINPGTNSESATAGASGGDVQVQIVNVCGTGPASSLTVTVSGGGADCPSSTSIAPGGTQSVCVGVGTSELTATISSTGGSGTFSPLYQWYYNGVADSNDPNHTNATLIVGATAQTYIPLSTISEVGTRYYFCVGYATDNTCGQSDSDLSLSSNTVEIIVKGNFTTPTITGPTNVAPLASTLAYSVPVVPGALTYTWTLPTGWSLDTDNGDNILVTSGNEGQNGDIQVDITYECGATPTTSVLGVTVSTVTDHTGITCATCHTLHNATGNVLTNSANADLCMSCHNNTPGSDAENKPFAPSDIAVPGSVSGNSHAWDVAAVNATFETNTPTNTEMSARMDGGNIICSTCHDQHSGNSRNFYLRIDNTDDAMCKDCHSARDVDLLANGGKGSHPIGDNVIYDDSDTRFNNTQTLIANGSKIQCLTCHGVHDVDGSLGLTNDGYLLKKDNSGDALCLDCHVPMTHNGMSCSNCHDVHNHTDKNNIYMIRSDIGGSSLYTTLGDGADGATNDGICEVCHTTTSYYKSDGTGAAHNVGSNCMDCHTHEGNFSGGSCVSCHNTIQAPDARSGAPQIVGTGGQFDILAQTSTHVGGATPSEPTKENCESCHYTGSHPTNAMGLRDVDAVDTEWATNNEAYCIQCHDSGMPTNIVDYSAFSTVTYDKSNFTSTSNKHDDVAINSCINCHDKHGSTNANLLTMDDTDNYTVCSSCHTSGQPAAAFPITGWTSGTNSHAWGVSASSGLNGTIAPTGGGMLDSRLSGGNIVCSTCHDVHDNTNSPNLVGVKDDMCIECHANRNQTNFAGGGIGHHPVGVTYTAGGDYVDPAPTLGDAQVGLVGGKVECSSCHKVHNGATNDGNLLREDMTVSSAVCKECHNYKTHSPNNHDCLDCHQMHNTTNVMLIRTSINTPVDGPVNVVFTSQGGVGNEANSFADGDANYNGVCEVCHDPAYDGTPLGHHRNDGSDGTNHNDGLNCTGCHAHNNATTSFPNSSCHSCHETPNEYPTSGSHTAHAGPPYYFACSTCHYQYGSGGALEPTHSSGTVNVNFDPNGLATRNGLDGNTPNWDGTSCTNVYCHSNGKTGQKAALTDAVSPALNWVMGPSIEGAAAMVYASPEWNNPATGACGQCHPTDQSLLGGNHSRGAHQVVCSRCHTTDGEETVNPNGTYGTNKHVDGDVWFDANLYGTRAVTTELGGTMSSSTFNAINSTTDHCGDSNHDSWY